MNPKLEVILSPYTGYCFGVKRAMSLIDRAVEERPGARIYTLGEIIHNPQEVSRLRDRGSSPYPPWTTWRRVPSSSSGPTASTPT